MVCNTIIQRLSHVKQDIQKVMQNAGYQSVQRTVGSLRLFQVVSYAQTFFCSQAFSTPAPRPPLTPAVCLFRAEWKKSGVF